MNSIPRKPLNLPSNVEAEQSLLGTLLVQNSAFDKVSDFLLPEHFHFPVHGRIFAAISDSLANGRTCSAAILKQMFANDPDLEGVGGVGYFADLMGGVVTLLNVEEYGRAILDLYQRRQVIEICDSGIGSLSTIEPGTKAADLITEMEAKLYAVAEGASERAGAKAFSGAISEAIASAGAAYRRDPGSVGIGTGLADVDKIMGGLRSPDLVILAGRPGMGKSALAMGMAWSVAAQGKTVGFFSLEMSADQLATRVLAADAGLPSDLIRRGDINRDQFNKFMQSGSRLASLPLYIDESAGQTIAYIRKGARRLKRQHGLGLIVVDYLQLINTFGKQRDQNRVQELTEITKGLKNLAKEFAVPVLALSQLSRAVEQRDDKRPQLSDLRESGSIEQDADLVAFIYREEYYLENGEPSCKSGESNEHFNERYTEWVMRKSACAGRAEFIVSKNRHGATGTAHLHFDGPTTTFSNLDQVYSVAGSR